MTAPSDGVWYFHVRARHGDGEWGPAATRKVQIGTQPRDTTPPTMSFSCPDDLTKWHNHDLDVTFTVTDTKSGPDVVLYSVDGSEWHELDLSQSHSLVFLAEQDHSCDKDWTILCKARDLAGNEGAQQSFHVKIDTRKPITKTPSAASVVRYRTAKLWYKVLDTGANGGKATVTIKIRTAPARSSRPSAPTRAWR